MTSAKPKTQLGVQGTMGTRPPSTEVPARFDLGAGWSFPKGSLAPVNRLSQKELQKGRRIMRDSQTIPKTIRIFVPPVSMP